jgi:hypothetical protein
MGTPEGGYSSVVRTFGGSAFAALPSEEVEPGVRRLRRRPFFQMLARRNAVFLGSLILRREVVEQSEGFDLRLFGSEDWDFVMRLAIRHEFAYCEDLPVAFYLQHAGGISRDGDRMEREFNEAIRNLARRADLDGSDRRWVQIQRARREFGFAYDAFDRGDLSAARERFTRCLRSQPDLRSLGYLLVSLLPLHVLRATRGLKRGILG